MSLNPIIFLVTIRKSSHKVLAFFTREQYHSAALRLNRKRIKALTYASKGKIV